MEYTFYRIKSKNPAITECYIGSTEDIEVRKSTHKTKCNNINDIGYNFKVYQYIRSNGGWDDFEFEIIDKIIFSETDRLLHENKLMDLYGSTLNSKRAIRTEEEKKEYHKEYHKEYQETHKEKILEQKKQYYEANTEKILEQKKRYYEANTEKIKEYDRQYYEANTEKILEQKKQYYEANKEKIREQSRLRYLKKKQEKLTQPNI
jgi:hypothetical protein